MTNICKYWDRIVPEYIHKVFRPSKAGLKGSSSLGGGEKIGHPPAVLGLSLYSADIAQDHR